MITTGFEVGTKVKHTTTGSVGVVVPSVMGLGAEGHVMVDFDGVCGDQVCLISELESLGKIQVRFDSAKCAGCIFANHSGCKRYGETRFGWLMSGERGKRWSPKRMYPLCQDERNSKTNEERKE